MTAPRTHLPVVPDVDNTSPSGSDRLDLRCATPEDLVAATAAMRNPEWHGTARLPVHWPTILFLVVSWVLLAPAAFAAWIIGGVPSLAVVCAAYLVGMFLGGFRVAPKPSSGSLAVALPVAVPSDVWGPGLVLVGLGVFAWVAGSFYEWAQFLRKHGGR